MTAQFAPFADDSHASAVGGLNLENGQDRIAIYGNLDLTRDKAGLAHARALKAVLDAVVQALEADPHLPDQAAAPAKPGTVRNPFS